MRDGIKVTMELTCARCGKKESRTTQDFYGNIPPGWSTLDLRLPSLIPSEAEHNMNPRHAHRYVCPECIVAVEEFMKAGKVSLFVLEDDVRPTDVSVEVFPGVLRLALGKRHLLPEPVQPRANDVIGGAPVSPRDKKVQPPLQPPLYVDSEMPKAGWVDSYDEEE